MKFLSTPLLACLALLGACRHEAPKVAAPPAEAAPGLKGKYVSVELSRSALGLSRPSPVSRGVDSLDGTGISVSGYVHAETGSFLVIGRFRETAKNEGLEWIPYSSILAVTQPVNQDRDWNQPQDGAVGAGAGSWRLERVESLMDLTGFDLTRLPEGELEIWIERRGEKEILTTAATLPGREQWLYIGLDPVSHATLVTTVVAKDTPGGGIGYYHGPDLYRFTSRVKDGHDWTKPGLIAEEATGDGKIYARLKPAK